MLKVLLIGLFGGLGSISRYLLGNLIHRHTGHAFPYGTLFVNLLGCLAAGIAAALFSRLTIPEKYQFAIAVGFLGGFTTFSAFSLQSFELLSTGHFPKALLYISLSLVLGILAVLLAMPCLHDSSVKEIVTTPPPALQSLCRTSRITDIVAL